MLSVILKPIKIQEQLMDIQKQLAEKEARWKETLLKEIGSLQVNSDGHQEYRAWSDGYIDLHCCFYSAHILE